MHGCIGASPTPAALRRTLPMKGREGGGAISGQRRILVQPSDSSLVSNRYATRLPPLYGEGGERSELGGVGVLRP